MGDESKLKKKIVLLSGPLPENGGSGKTVLTQKDSYSLINNSFWGIKSIEGDAFVSTNDVGELYSVDKAFLPKKKSNNHLKGAPLTLSPLPKGIVNFAVVAHQEKWQEKLIEVLSKKDAAGENSIKTVPIEFKKENLEKPHKYAPQSEKDKFGLVFGESSTYYGQLIPKSQAIFIVMPETFFKTGSVPDKIEVLDSNKENLTFTVLTQDKKLYNEEFNSFTGKKEKTNIAIFNYVSFKKHLSDGVYTIRIPKAQLSSNLQEWCTHNNESYIYSTIDVGFNIKELFGDVDFHVLSPLSVEDAIINNYPERFNDLKKSLLPKGEDDPKVPKLPNSLKDWATRLKWTKGKVDLITGWVDMGSTKDKNTNEIAAGKRSQVATLIKLGMDGVSESARLNGNTELQNIANNLATIPDTFIKAQELNAKWKKFYDDGLSKFSEAYQKISKPSKDVLDEIMNPGGFFKNVKNSSKTLKRINAIDIRKLSNANYANKVMRSLLFDALPKEAIQFEQIFKSTAGMSLLALDCALSIYEIAGILKTRSDMSDEYKVMDNRLNKGAGTYLKRFEKGFNADAISKLEGYRKNTDILQLKLDEETMKMIESSIDFALSVACFVPVVGEIVTFALLLKASGQLALTGVANVGKIIDTAFFDDMFQDGITYRKKLDLSQKEAFANIDACRDQYKSCGNKDTDPAVQLRVRTAVILGLVRLIDRCGSRFNKDHIGFEEKIKQYKIKEYIDTFILNIDENEEIALQSRIPLDELWLYCYGNKNGFEMAKAVFKLKAQKTTSTLPYIVDMPINLLVGNYIKAANIAFAPNAGIKYQKNFPIHKCNSANVLELAKTFCTDYSGVKSDDCVFARIYAQTKDKKWVDVESYPTYITPVTPLRIVTIFKGDEDLTSMPLSVQLIRTDTLPDVPGPVYKGVAFEMKETIDKSGDGDDKGLFKDIVDEASFISTKDMRYYGYVFFPFYSYEKRIIKGAKPCGHIGITPNPDVDVKFKLKVCNGAKDFKVYTGKSKETSFTMHMPLKSELFSGMICNSHFLKNKTSKETVKPFFQNNSKILFEGILLKNSSGQYVYYDGSKNELDAGKDFAFSWNEPFEPIIIIKTSSYMDSEWSRQKRVRFPVFVCHEDSDAPGWEAGEDEGPVYSAEFHMMNEKVPGISNFARWANFHDPASDTYKVSNERISDRLSHLFDKDSINSIDFSKRKTKYLDMPSFFKHGDILHEDIQNGYLLAMQLSFTYSVEDDEGSFVSIKGLRPFGQKYYTSGNNPYKHRLSIYNPQMGLKEIVTPWLKLPPIDPASMPYNINKKFVTGHANKELNVMKADYMEIQ